MLLLTLACTIDVSRFTAFQALETGDYRIGPREIESLQDPLHMQGELGEVLAGGVLHVNLGSGELDYRGGRRVEVLATVDGGVATPWDIDGLILYSFYGHLQDTRDTLAQAGVDISPLFPVHIAVTPAVPDIGLALLPVENAAYAPSANTFILLSDLSDKPVPLAANAGVVAHEMGHGVFHLLTTGDPYAPKAFPPTTAGGQGVSSLDEGFGDMMGSLITDAPAFITPSLDLPGRDVSAERLASDVISRPEAGLDALSYDPYALGSVFAAVAWDIRVQTDDRQATLTLVCGAVSAWAQAERGATDAQLAYRWLDHLFERSDSGQRAAACDSIALRFEGVYIVEACP